MKTRLIAHRGASAHAPENTASALSEAAAQGVAWVEVDATISADEQVVLFHDDSLERCSNGHGYVAAQTLRSLQSLDMGSWFSSAFCAEQILTLDQGLDLCQRLGLSVQLEIKCPNGLETATANAVMANLSARTQSPPIMLSSFSERALQIARQAMPQLPRALLCEFIPPDWAARLEALDCAALHWCGDTPWQVSQVRAIGAAGYRQRVYTVDDPESARMLLAAGIDALFCNAPAQLARALQL